MIKFRKDEFKNPLIYSTLDAYKIGYPIVDEIEKDIKELQQENQQLKEILERINNYLDKNYAADNQYYFDHIQDIIKER